MTTWHAESAAELREIAGVIHDAWFDVDEVGHDATTQTLIIPFAQEWERGQLHGVSAWRDAPTTELVKTTSRYREERVPFMRGTLRIGAVESVAINPRAGDAGMLVDVRFEAAARSITVDGVSGELRARVERLDVTAELLNEVALYVRRRHGLFGGASDQRLGDSTP